MGKQVQIFQDDEMGVPLPDHSCYRRLIRDPHVCAGAFRLWHYLRDRASAKNGSRCWPAQRLIADEISCKRDSLGGWIQQLEAAGYLRTNRDGKNHHTVYTLLDGSRVPLFDARRGPQRGATPRPPKRACLAPKGGPPRGPSRGTLSKPSKVNPRSEGAPSPTFAPVRRDLFPREYDHLLEEAKRELQAAKANSELRTRTLVRDVAESRAWLLDRVRENPADATNYLARIAQIEANPVNWTVGELSEEGHAVVNAWSNRIQEIKDAMSGRIR